MPEASIPSDDADWAVYIADLGHLVRSARENTGYSQDRAAAESGITRTHYQRIEQGVSGGTPANPTLRTILRIAAALGVDVKDLLPR